MEKLYNWRIDQSLWRKAVRDQQQREGLTEGDGCGNHRIPTRNPCGDGIVIQLDDGGYMN